MIPDARSLSRLAVAAPQALLATACGGGGAEGRGLESATTAAHASAPTRVSATPAPEGTDAKLKWALAGEQRSADNRARDVYRHPYETLSFFGLKDDMTVVELYPGGGWYTEVLAPVLRDRGKLVVSNFESAFGKRFDAKLAASPAIYDKVDVRMINPPKSVPLGPDGSADLVLTFRNVHNWMQDGDTESMFAAAFRVLKPGGTFGVVEHRAPAGASDEQMKKTGYVSEEKVLAFAKAAGFVLEQKSEINANPKDTKDHPNGVWSLPPALRGGEVDKAKFLAIGESDRMTLKLKKP
ncbi:MAG: methyltransferase domain-containing protein [Polyangiaceae bacterium]